MAVVTIFTLVLAALLLFLPVIQALWFLLFARDSIGSAWIFVYSVLVVLLLVIGVLARRFSLNLPGWSNVGKFFVSAVVLAVLSCIGAIAIGASVNLRDSGAGESVDALLLGAAGIVVLCTSGLLSQTRRALTSDSSGRRGSGAAESGR
jgi:hypothetical protein